MRSRAAVLVLLPVLGACQAHISGLLPISPSPLNGRVDSLTPTLRWEALPVGDEARITEVVYDLKVLGQNGAVAYLKEGLTECEHRLELPLQPDARYEWTVRARFRWQGERRLTQWSGISRMQERQAFTPVPPGAYLPLRTSPDEAPR